MAAPAQRRVWPVLTAMAGACTLLAVGLVLSGNATPSWWTVAAGLALLTVVFALGSLFSSGAQARDLNEAHARAAAAEDECTLLQRDVNRHDQLEQQLLQAKRAAESAALAKGEFLATMSHEIRTPLNGIIPMLDLVARGNLAPDQREMLRTAHESSLQLLRIVDDILDYSKLEANRLELEITSFNLRELLEAVLQLMQRPAESKGLRLDLNIDPNVRLPVRGDPVRMRQVLTNLIGNAVKFTETGHVLTRVVGVESEADSQTLHVTVEDTGIGVAPEYLDHIFGEFNQVEDERNRKFEGTGLGLAITRRLIERMGGAVWVDSEPGQGSSFGFRVTLPVAEDAGPVQVPVSVRRVLAVDDQFINRTILERQLTPCGIEVTLCRSGAEVLERLATDPYYDVILTDHAMPEMDGDVLLQHIRAAGHGLPVILLSSNPSHLAAGATQEFAAILQKPVLRSDLYRHLQALTAPAAPALPRLVLKPVELRQLRVLAAEDNRTNQLVFQKMVRAMDLDLVFADNGRIAVETFESYRPDIVFMDISMPEMDGKEAARAIRALEGQGAHVPIIALTAHAMEGDAEAILAAGIDQYLTKPLRKAAIEAALIEHCPPGVRTPVPPAEDAA